MIKIDIYNDSDLSIDSKSIEKFVTLIIQDHGYSSAIINLIITDDEALRKMKKKYFNQDYYTDVIAFNIEKDPFEGEIYISYDRVKNNASQYNQSFQKEFKRVIIHGLLHLYGYKDSTNNEKIKMTSLEEKFLKKFNENILN